MSAPAAATWLPDEQRERVDRRVPQQRHGGLELAEAVRDGRRGIGCKQQRMVDAIRDVRLDRGPAAHAHLLDRAHQLDGREQREHGREFCRRHAAHEPADLVAGHARIHDHARHREVVECHRLGRDTSVDPVAGDELVEQVEVGLGDPVELDDPPVGDPQRRRRIGRARERDQPDRGILGHEHVAADRALLVEGGA